MSKILLYLILLLSVLVSYGAKAQKRDTILITFETKCHPGVLWSGWQVRTSIKGSVVIRTFSKDWNELDTKKCPINQYFVTFVPRISPTKKSKNQ